MRRQQRSSGGSALKRVLIKTRELVEEVRETAESVHQQAQEARRMTDTARQQVERGRELSQAGRNEARAVTASIKESVDNAGKGKRRPSAGDEV